MIGVGVTRTIAETALNHGRSPFCQLAFYVVGAFAVDSRAASSGSMAISESSLFFPSMRSSRVCAATSPMRFSGWRTVVRLGV